MNPLQQTPPITKNLLIINSIVLLAQYVLQQRGIADLSQMFGLHFILADDFRPWQLVTYMFLHDGLSHLFFNMFALWMFGMVIERTLGFKRFLIYYFVCGIGAGLRCRLVFALVVAAGAGGRPGDEQSHLGGPARTGLPRGCRS